MSPYIFDDRFIEVMPSHPLHEVMADIAEGFRTDTRTPWVKLIGAIFDLWTWPLRVYHG